MSGSVIPAGGRLVAHPGPFRLESGIGCEGVEVAYHTWGRLNREADNGVLVCHALTGFSHVPSWWPALVGPGAPLDTEQDFVVCANVLGSCYGTTGPASPRPDGGGWWGPDFPEITIRDMVHLQAWLLDRLGVRRLRLVIGGSMGGMQVLEWAALYPDRVEAIAPIATSARHSAWCIGLSEAQRRAITADPRWRQGWYPPHRQPARGLAVARMIAMCTYRSWSCFGERFDRRQGEDGAFEVERYLDYQGSKLVRRFDANTYLTLTRAMDTHDLGRGRGDYREVLRSIEVPALVVSVTSDLLYPPQEQHELATWLPRAEPVPLESPHGHDGFLIESDALGRLIHRFRSPLPPWTMGRGGGKRIVQAEEAAACRRPGAGPAGPGGSL